MNRNDLSKQDISVRQQAALDSVLREATAAPKVSVSDARNDKSVYEVHSNREAVRLLFISRDTTLLNQTQQSLDGYLALGEVFDEVHIVILRPGIAAKTPILRVTANVWIYIATATHWWQTPFAALKMIAEQLVFAEGFRPDLIVARDPFECALVAYIAGQQYNRPIQLHVTDDFTSDTVMNQFSHAWMRKKIAHHLLPLFPSIRTTTNQLREKIAATHPGIPDLSTLPRLNNYENFFNEPIQINLKNKYHGFSFVFLYFGALTHKSSLPLVLDAMRDILSNPRIGLVVVGDGAYRDDLIRKTKTLKISEQVIFEKTADDFSGYLKTADALIVTDIDAVADEIVIRGAVVGIPVVCVRTPLREDLFTQGESALFCDPSIDSIAAYTQLLLDDFDGRQRLRYLARATIASRLLQDKSEYKYMFKTSVEQGLFAGAMVAPSGESVAQ
jgi:glycosyltransferase involved in cell wall biosynthesis